MISLTDDETMIARTNLLAFLKGIGLDQVHLQKLVENGFDNLENIEPLTEEMSMSLGLKYSKDAATLVESKNSLFKFLSDHECTLEDALMNYDRIIHGNHLNNITITQGSFGQKKRRDEKFEIFFSKIITLSISGKGLEEMVYF